MGGRDPSPGNSYTPLLLPVGLQVNKLEITTDKRLLAAAGNPQIRLFEVASGNNQAVLTYEGHSSNVTAVGIVLAAPLSCAPFRESSKAECLTWLSAKCSTHLARCTQQEGVDCLCRKCDNDLHSQAR